MKGPMNLLSNVIIFHLSIFFFQDAQVYISRSATYKLGARQVQEPL